MLQHLRGVHVLPPAVADTYGTDFIVVGHQPNSISQTAITSTTAGFRSLEIVEDFKWANKQADIDSIVFAKVFPDVEDFVFAGLDLHRIFQIENRIEFPVHCDVEVIGIKRIRQTTAHGTVKKMVAHREKKGLADAVSGSKKRDAIPFLPVTVFDEGDAEASRNQLLALLDHTLASVTNHEVDRSDPAVKQG